MEDLLIYTLNWRGLRLTLEEIKQIECAVRVAGIGDFEQALDETSLRLRILSLDDWREKGLRELHWIQDHGCQLVTPAHPNYPDQFRDLRFPPLGIVLKGDVSVLNQKMLAVVGSRNPSSWTKQWLQDHLADFADRKKVAIVSGGARGVDQWAHSVSIAKSCPRLCFLPSGMQKIYPPSFSRMMDQFQQQNSAIVSQFSPFQPIYKSQFSARNELIVVISKSVFVVEARLKSGSMLTARLAHFHNRDVMTLPFHPGSHLGAGNLELIFSGALIIRDSRDLCEAWEQLGGGSFESVESNCKASEIP